MTQGFLFAISPRVESVEEFENLTALHLPTVAMSIARENRWDDTTLDLFLNFTEKKIVRVFNHSFIFRTQMVEHNAPRYLKKWFEHWAKGKFLRFCKKINPQPAAEYAVEKNEETGQTLYRIFVSGKPWEEYEEPGKLRMLRLQSNVSIVAVSRDRTKHEQRAAWLAEHLPDETIEVEPVGS